MVTCLYCRDELTNCMFKASCNYNLNFISLKNNEISMVKVMFK